MKKPKIGIDNYGLFPLQLSPMETIQWAIDHGAEGVSFSGLDENSAKLIEKAYLRDITQFVVDNNLYLEWGGAQHVPRDMSSWRKKELFLINEKAAIEAEVLGVRIVRSCSGGLMRWNPDNPVTGILLKETANALRSQRQMLKDHNVILAIETHFEFTTFELLRLFEMCDAEPGDYLGICLDTMNLLTMLEDPISATQRILPWVVSTHIKDGALLLTEKGLVSFPTEIGKGVIDFMRIVKLLDELPWNVSLSVEDHGGEFQIPVFDPVFLSGFPDLTVLEFAKLMELAYISKIKHDRGECAITERGDWGRVCEERLSQGMVKLRDILNGNGIQMTRRVFKESL